MGNVASVPENREDEEYPVYEDNYENESGEVVVVQNGPATLQNAQPVSFQKIDLVDARTSDQQNNVTISSQKTMEISSASDESGKNPGMEAKADVPPARSRFRMSLSRPVPARPAAQTPEPPPAAVTLEVVSEKPPVNNGPSENTQLPELVQLKESSVEVQALPPNAASASTVEVVSTQSPEAENTQSKPREISLFDKLFKPEKAKGKSPEESPPEVQVAVQQEPVLVVNASSAVQNSAPPQQDAADSNQNTVNLQQSATVSFAEDIQEPEASPESNKTATPTEEHPVMSFFKTLVNKPPTKTEEEPKREPEEKRKGNGACKKSPKVGFTLKGSKSEKSKGAQPALQLKAETQATGLKAKTQESPTKRGTLSRLFRSKSSKETQETTVLNVAPEQAVVTVTVKSEKASPAQTVKQEKKAAEATSQQQQQIPKAPEIQKDAAKESTPRTRLFWKKSIKEEPQVIEPPENSMKEEPQVIEPTVNNPAEPEMDAIRVQTSLQASAPNKVESKSQEVDDKSKKAKEDSKPAKPKLMTFFKQLAVNSVSVIGDGGNANSAQINVKEPNQPTLDSTDGAAAKPSEKSVAPVVVEVQPPTVQLVKESPKDKKATVEQSKQESKENLIIVSAAPPPVSASVVLENGESSPRQSPKRLEKRQSFGAFFKGIGPKRTCDAEAQTDPVSILPAN